MRFGKPATEELLTYTTAAVPHEAGHILIVRTVGLPVRALDHFVIRGSNNEMLPGNFATVGVAPISSAAVAITPKPVHGVLGRDATIAGRSRPFPPASDQSLYSRA